MNTTFGDILHEGFSLLNKDPEILNKIEYDLDCYTMKKRTKRLADKAWQNRQTLPLGLELQKIVNSLENEEKDTEENSESKNEKIKISLGIGRPRMKPEAVFLFILFRGYFESVTYVRATDRIIDSITIRNFFQNYIGGNLPKRSTIHDNIQAVSYDTRTYIYPKLPLTPIPTSI